MRPVKKLFNTGKAATLASCLVACLLSITSFADEQWDRSLAENRNVRFVYISTPWAKVLNDVAEKTGSTLVVHDMPPGRISRQDWNRYNREEALQIVNRELDPLGFRVIAKDQFLTVMQTRRVRAEYQRPVAPALPPVPVKDAGRMRVPEFDANEGVVQASGVSEENAFKPASRNTSRRPHLIQQANHEQADQEQTTQDNRGPQETTAPRDNSPQTTLKLQPRHRDAVEIAKQIHSAFKTRARLEDRGPNGLPAFVVDHYGTGPEAARPQFSVEIDTEQNQLLITASATVQAGLQNLIRRIDVNPISSQPVPKLMSGDGQLAETGKRLQGPLSIIANERRRLPESATILANEPEMLAQADPNSPPPMANDGSSPKTAVIGRQGNGLPALLGNLKGDVSIEALDDLDLLILRGNEKDVEAVMQVIQTIEQLAIGSLPEIHLLKLQHVNSESLTALLNDVYSQLSELRNNNAQQSATSVRVVPVVTPNAVLILAPANTMQSILDLADELDQPIDPEHEVEVFNLKHAVASTVATTVEEFYGEEPVGLATRLKVAADTRTNSLIIQARPRDLSEIAALIRKIDNDDAHAVSQVKLFPLKSAVAEELAQFLNSAVQSVADPRASTVGQTSTNLGGNNNLANQEAKSVVLEFLAEDGQRLLRSGLLSDIRFNSDPRTNTLMVTAPAQSMPLIGELIRILDRPSDAVAEIKVFPLKNADAADAVVLLEELFGDTQTQQTTNQNRALGVDLIGTQGAVSNLIPLRFSVDPRSNSVVAIGGPEAIRVVEAMLYRLDQTGSRNRKTTVVKLRNSYVADVATAINTFLQSQRDLATIDPDRISTSQLLEQEVIVTPELISNSLIISATPTYFNEVYELAMQLDASPPQVMIQALLVEVELNNTDEFGVELGFQDSVLFDRGILGEMVTITETLVNGSNTTQTVATNPNRRPANPGFDFNNQPLGQNTADPSTVGSQGLSNFALGRVNNDLGYGGLVLSASSESVNVLIRALAARRTLRILSRPQISALDNQLAQIQVGQVVPVTDGVTITNNNVTPLITRDPAGIILTVTPRISDEGQIVMEVVAEKSEYLNEGVTVFTDTNGSEVTSPIKNITTAQTTVKVPDGQTIVVGGMITKSDDNIERKVPWLGDLPLIGRAFRFDTYDHRRTELLIFLTPRIVHHPADSEAIKQIEAQRLHYFEAEAEEVHGPLFGVPPEMAMPIDGYSIDAFPLEVSPGMETQGNIIPPASNVYELGNDPNP